MTSGELQEKLFTTIRKKVDSSRSVVNEVAKLLEISTDSAYRRMRGEITVPFHELYLLCKHFEVSLDGVMNLSSSGIQFQGNYVTRDFQYDDYLQNVMKNMMYMNSFKENFFYYLCKDLPIFHYFHFREIAAFKRFFWLKSYFGFPEFSDKKFRFEEHTEELFQLEQNILDLYNKIPSVEMWNLEIMNIFFRQIDFYRDGDIFESDEDVFRLYTAMEKLWNHLEEQAARGYKFRLEDTEKKPIASLSIYFNEVLMGDNNMMVELDGVRIAYVSHSTINYMYSSDKGFTDNMYNHIQNQMKRSTLISEVSEKERSRFFRIIRDMITRRKQALGA